jgi:serine protease AprX
VMKGFRVAVIALLCVMLLHQSPRLSSLPHSPADLALAGPPSSLIIQGSDAAAVASRVRAVGGVVTHELGIINAVAARLTVGQAALLRNGDPKLRFYLDREVRPAAVTTATRAVADDFAQVSYSNNTGTQSWSTSWVELNDDGQPYASEGISIQNDLSNSRLRIASNGKSIWRQAGIPSTASFATLTLKYRRVNLESTDYVAVQASSDGGKTWKEVGRIKGPANDSSYLTASFDFTAYRSGQTGVRFVSTFVNQESTSTYPVDAVYIDDVQLSFDGFLPGTKYPALAGAQTLHQQGITGDGIGVAILDSGYWTTPSVDYGAAGWMRLRAEYDAIQNRLIVQNGNPPITNDGSGHGSHVTSLIANSSTVSGKFFGVAPNAQLISVKAFDNNGAGKYADVIRGLDWIVNNRYPYSIRVINCSFSTTPRSYYWDDPLAQAVMRAWQAGIVVVASAGNRGPQPMTIGVPGNVPYVITVGAMSDSVTATNLSDDVLASFSSAGPTVEGFVKPDVVAPGGHAWGVMSSGAKIAQTYPQFKSDGDFFSMSGTSQSSAVVTGVVALMLQKRWRTPDDVKCDLLVTARPAATPGGNRAYSVFQQGSGLIDAVAAVNSVETGCANRGMNIGQDIAGTTHYGGPANRDGNGTYYLMGMSGSGYTWNGVYTKGSGYIWGDGYTWNDGYTWSDGYTWNDGYFWSDGYVWNDGYPWSDSLNEAVAINVWVPQE